MSTDNNIQFDEFKIKSRSILGQSKSPAMIRSLLKHGVFKSERSANNFLIALTTLSLLIAVYVFAVFVFDFKVIPKETITKEEIQANKERIQQQRRQSTPNQQTN